MSGGWTPAMDKRLRKSIAAGESAREAAARLYVTRNAAIGRAWRLGLSFGGGHQARAWTEADDAYLKATAGAAPVDQIAQAVGRTAAAVTKRAHVLGVSLRQRTGS